MTYADCTAGSDVCLQVWLIDDQIITGIIALVVAVFVIKMILKITPFIG